MRKKLLRKLPKLTYQLDLFSDLDKRKRYYEAQTAVNHYLYIEIKMSQPESLVKIFSKDKAKFVQKVHQES